MRARPDRRARRRRAAAWGRAFGLGAVVLTLAAPASAQVTPAVDHDRGEDLEELLRSPGAEPVDAAALAVLLLEASPAEVDRWLDALDAALEASRHAPLERRALERLEVEVRQVPELVETMLAEPELSVEARAHALTIALEVLERTRRPSSFRRLMGIVPRAGQLPPASAAAPAEALRSCLGALSSLRLHSQPQLEHLYRTAPAALTVAVVDGVARGADPEFAARSLARLLEVLPDHDPAVLNRLHLVLNRQPPGPAPGIADRVAPYLEDPRPFARHQAAACLGRTGRREHVEALIGGLSDPEVVVRSAARDALGQLTGMSLPADADRWRGWLAGQLAWWEEDGADRLHDLGHAARSEQLTILREVCDKRLFHEEIAVALRPLLESVDEEEQRLALSALGTLRSPTALDMVRAFEDHPEPRVREAARAALRSYRQARACLQQRPALAGR